MIQCWVELCRNGVKAEVAPFTGQRFRIRLNKVGMVNGHVDTISPDPTELPDTRERDSSAGEPVDQLPLVLRSN
jgi:hypothetical protein